jgi:uncharacterized caspase-like protein
LAFGETTVKLWDVVTGREQLTVSGKATSVSAAFAPSGRWFVSSASDGSVTLWDSQTGAQLATLLSVGQTPDWVVVTPEGLFDGSPAGWQLVLWRLGGNTFDVAPAETFFNEFFYPGLLGELLAGKRPQPRRTVAEIDRRQPVLKLSHATPQTVGQAIKTRQVTLKIEVQEALPDTTHASGSGTRDVRLFRNSSLVKLWRGDVLQGNTGRVLLEATVPIIAGENRFTAYAFNRDNIKSADARLIMAGTENLKRKGTAYILVIGINRYSNEDYKLNYAVADATAFAEELGRQLKMLGAYAEVKIITLLNQDATKANILEALGRLAGERTRALPAATATVLAEIQPVEPEDAVFMYFAGHGTAAGPRFYLIPHDLGYAGHRTALDEPSLKTILEHSISDRELEQSFEKIDAGRLLLVIDACNSGQALEAEEKRRGPMNATGLAQLAYEKGMYILTAAQSYQAALEAAPLGHGLLTFALVEEGLKTRAADTDPKDDEVTVREWLNYAVDRVPQLQERMMEEARKLGREVVMVEGEQAIRELKKRSLQRPRVFYRREPELDPLIVARLASVQTNVRTAPVPAGPSIVGKWRVTYIGTPLPNQPKGHMVGEMDYEFRSDGTFVFTYSGGPVPAQRSRGQYNWLSPNRLRLAYGGNVELVMEVTALTADKMTWKSIQTWELEHIY